MIILIIFFILCFGQDANSEEFDGLARILDKLPDGTRRVQLCGFEAIRNPSMFVRVVGGVQAKKDKHQWLVSMQRRKGRGWAHFCGATILATHWLMTASHCAEAHKKRNIRFVAGEHNLDRRDGTEQYLYPEDIFRHADYNLITQENDIALVKLKNGLVMSKRSAAPICLPNYAVREHSNCVIAGWGHTKEGGVYSPTVRTAVVPIITDQDCQKRFRDQSLPYYVADNMICAFYDTGGRDACQGDSGGPLVCPGPKNLPVIAGIVSWGVGCGSNILPGVYTEIYKYQKWIYGTITSNSKFTSVIGSSTRPRPSLFRPRPSGQVPPKRVLNEESILESPFSESSIESDSHSSEETSSEENSMTEGIPWLLEGDTLV